MRWILGRKEGPLLLPADWEDDWTGLWREEFVDPQLCYGGFVWSDLIELQQSLNAYHSRLCSDFQSGWSAVGLVARDGGKVLGPWGSPTTARPHNRAPLGLYLLSPSRLIASLPAQMPSRLQAEVLCRKIHDGQRELGPIFCDPNLEVELPHWQRDFCYEPPSRLQRFRSAAAFFFGLDA